MEKMAEEGEPSGCQLFWGLYKLPALYRPMRGQGSHGSLDPSAPGGADPHMNEEAWEDFWQTLDFIRLQLERPLSTSFRASFDKLLPFRERLPGSRRRRDA